MEIASDSTDPQVVIETNDTEDIALLTKSLRK
jgi:hypothetical protein